MAAESFDSNSRERHFQEVLADYLQAVESGQAPDRQELLGRHPELAGELAAYFDNRDCFDRLAEPLAVEGDVPSAERDVGVADASDRSSALTLAPGETAAAVGTKVRYFGDYELLEEIGRGGMGVVYKARQVNLKRVVALKMILTGQLAHADDVRRFHAEAEAAAKLDHPGIVPVFEVGQHEGHHYFSMGFIEGESLAHQLTAGLPSARQATELIKSVAEAVAYADVEGVIHRDLKPANILIDKTGQPRLTDFGLAKHVEREAQDARQDDVTSGLRALTQTGQILGTPSYMPPEQASGERGVVGPLADIYSLGAVLYCLLTGRPPFQAANPLDTLLQVLSCEPAPPRQLNAAVPRDLETICLKCLNKETRKRYASAQDLVADLERFLNGQPIVARPTGVGERILKWVKRRPAAAALVLVSGIATVGVLLLLVALLRNAEQRAEMVQDLTVAGQDLQLARDATAKEQNLAQKAQAHLQTAKQEQLAAEKAAELQKQLAKETQKKMDTATENFRTVFRSMDNNLQTMIKATEKQKQLAKEMQAKAKREADGLRLIGQSSALRVNNPGLALLLAIEGQKLAPGLMANNALREAIDECHEEQTIPVGYAFRSAWYTPDGKQIISIPPAGADSTVRLWEAATGKHMGGLELPRVTISSAIPSPDGKQIVFTFEHHNRMIWSNRPPEIIYTDCVARVWDVAQRREIAILRGHKSRVVTAHFRPDGKKLVTASWDGTVRIWDAGAWKEERVITAHAAGAAGAFFSPDGKSILTASTNFLRDRSGDVELPKAKNALLDPPAGTLPPGVKPGDLPGSSGYSNSGGGRQLEEKTGIIIWDAATGQQRVALKHAPKFMPQSPDGVRFPLAWSPKGDQVLTWSPAVHNAITLWDAVSGEAQVKLATGFLKHVLFSPDGTRVLTAPSERSELNVWDAASGKETLVIRVPGGITGAPSYSPDGRWIVAACGDKAARIWSADTGEELWCFRGHQFSFASTAFNPDGKRVVTSAPDGTVRIWSTQRGRDFARVFRAAQPMHHLAFSPNGKRLATAAVGDRYHVEHPALWDVETGKLLHTLQGLAALGTFPVRDRILGETLSLEFSADGRHLLVATKQGPAKILKRPLLGFGKEIEEEVPFTPVRLWDVETGKEVRAFRGPRGEIGKAMFSPNGKLVLAAESGSQEVRTFLLNGNQMSGSGGTVRDGQAYVWDADSGKLLQTIKGHEYGIVCAAWSPDSKRVLTADHSQGFKADDGAARIWDVATGKEAVRLEGNRGGIRLATFSPDGKHVAMLQHPAAYYVEIWDAATGQIVLTLGRPTYYKYLQYPDAKVKKTVYKRNGRVVHVAAEGVTPVGHTGWIAHAAYSPDGRRIVTTSADKTARIWDAATGKQLLVLRGHILGLQHAAFSADGKRVVTSSIDETARVWDAETGTEIVTLAGHKAVVQSAVFSPDGTRVATASADGTARIWPLDPLPLALARKPRELSADERERFEIGAVPNP